MNGNGMSLEYFFVLTQFSEQELGDKMRNADAGQAVVKGMPKTNSWDFLVLPFYPIRWYLWNDIVRQVTGVCHDMIENHRFFLLK